MILYLKTLCGELYEMGSPSWRNWHDTGSMLTIDALVAGTVLKQQFIWFSYARKPKLCGNCPLSG